jgi:16S rRNA (guanine527-N7)-methyltransferase
VSEDPGRTRSLLLGFLGVSSAEWGVSLPENVFSQLAKYLDLVLRWGKKLRITGARAEQDVIEILIGGSIGVIPFLPSTGSVIDIGSGSGVPGVLVAVARPDLRVVLLEASRKKARFLEIVTEELGLRNVEVISARAEELAHAVGHREGYDAAMARAVAEVRVLVEYAMPFLRVGGIAIFPKGATAEEELSRAVRALELLGGDASIGRAPGRPGSTVVLVRKRSPTPPVYPRRPGVPIRRPL